VKIKAISSEVLIFFSLKEQSVYWEIFLYNVKMHRVGFNYKPLEMSPNYQNKIFKKMWGSELTPAQNGHSDFYTPAQQGYSGFKLPRNYWPKLLTCCVHFAEE